MARPQTIVLIPESTRKVRGSEGTGRIVNGFLDALPEPARGALQALREEMFAKSAPGTVDRATMRPAYRLFDGNMYRRIPQEAWEERSPNVEVVIASGLYGLVTSRDTIARYTHSMAGRMPPFGKLNRWWNGRGLPGILAAYLREVRAERVADLLSLEYREAVTGYADGVRGIDVETIDFPGMGRASQPRRGEKIAEILRTGEL